MQHDFMKITIISAVFFLAPLQKSIAQDIKTSKNSVRPNIVIIMADDMGFSDLGFMGSLINTPNIDNLANSGILYRQFYNTGRCCPSRASLLTGLYAHQTGMGWMTAANLGEKGYIGDLNNSCVTIAQLLKQNNYATYMTGKWHLTSDSFTQETSPKHNWPLQRGFDKYFGHLNGGGSYYQPDGLVYGNHIIKPPDSLYITNAVTDSTISFLEQHFLSSEKQPFFFYVAFYAPHRPLQALQKDIDPYYGKFMGGWDTLRDQKIAILKQRGIADASWKLSVRDKRIPPWEDISAGDKIIWDARMAVYAAQLSCMDKGIGEIIATLKKHNQFNNTIIFFMSDNGGNQEMESNELEIKLENAHNIQNEKPAHSYHMEWASVSNTPFRMYKSQVYEGGIASPLIIHWPDGISSNGNVIKQVSHITDLMPTILELAGVSYPARFKDSRVYPLEGISLVKSFKKSSIASRTLFFEHEANRAVINGHWKLVANKDSNPPYISNWELYNLKIDRTETNNLAAKYPQKVKQLSALWYQWAKTHLVLPLDGRGWSERVDKIHQ